MIWVGVDGRMLGVVVGSLIVDFFLSVFTFFVVIDGYIYIFQLKMSSVCNRIFPFEFDG